MRLNWIPLFITLGVSTWGQTPGPTTAPTLAPSTSPTPPTNAPSVSPTMSPTPQGPRVGLARVSRRANLLHGGDRQDVLDYTYLSVGSAFSGQEFASVDQTFVMDEIFSMQAEIFFQINDNDVILDAIKAVRCDQINCALSSAVYPGVNTTRVAFRVILTSTVGQESTAQGEYFDGANFHTLLLMEMNNTLQDPNFNYTMDDILARSEEGSIYYQADVYRDVLVDPTDLKSKGFVLAAEKLVDEKFLQRFLHVAGPGDNVEDTEVDYCVLRNTCLDCDRRTGDCQSCPTDTWGLDCEVPCTCSNNGTCGADNCICEYPDMGLRCDLQRNCSSPCTPAGTPPPEHSCCSETPRPEWCHEPQYICEENCCDVAGGPNDWCKANNCCGCVPGFNCGDKGCVPVG